MRPYNAGRPVIVRFVYYHNDMDMIRHDDPCVQRYFPAYFLGSQQFLFYDFAVRVQHHLPVGHTAEQTQPVLGTNGYAIRAFARIIVGRQADGTSAAGAET